MRIAKRTRKGREKKMALVGEKDKDRDREEEEDQATTTASSDSEQPPKESPKKAKKRAATDGEEAPRLCAGQRKIMRGEDIQKLVAWYRLDKIEGEVEMILNDEYFVEEYCGPAIQAWLMCIIQSRASSHQPEELCLQYIRLVFQFNMRCSAYKEFWRQWAFKLRDSLRRGRERVPWGDIEDSAERVFLQLRDYIKRQGVAADAPKQPVEITPARSPAPAPNPKVNVSQAQERPGHGHYGFTQGSQGTHSGFQQATPTNTTGKHSGAVVHQNYPSTHSQDHQYAAARTALNVYARVNAPNFIVARSEGLGDDMAALAHEVESVLKVACTTGYQQQANRGLPLSDIGLKAFRPRSDRPIDSLPAQLEPGRLHVFAAISVKQGATTPEAPTVIVCRYNTTNNKIEPAPATSDVSESTYRHCLLCDIPATKKNYSAKAKPASDWSVKLDNAIIDEIVKMCHTQASLKPFLYP